MVLAAIATVCSFFSCLGSYPEGFSLNLCGAISIGSAILTKDTQKLSERIKTYLLAGKGSISYDSPIVLHTRLLLILIRPPSFSCRMDNGLEQSFSCDYCFHTNTTYWDKRHFISKAIVAKH